MAPNVSALYRTIYHDDEYTSSAMEVFGSVERADDVLSGELFVLSRDPSGGHVHVVHTGPPCIYALKTGLLKVREDAPAQSVVIVFSATQQTLTLHDVYWMQ